MAPGPSQPPDRTAAPIRQPTGGPLLELIAIMDRLRSPGGCPWDAQQTHHSLVTYLLEEAYEAVEAIEAGDRKGMREELGDLLLQVMFHSRIAAEDPDDPWTVDDVAAGIGAKLVSRHPHVFGDETAETAEIVESAWQARKAAEKSRESVLDGLPSGLPALLLAEKMTHRAANGGVVVPAAGEPVLGIAAGALEAIGVSPRAASDDPGAAELGGDEFGDLLLSLVVLGRERGLDAEASLRHALRGYADRIRAAEAR